MFELLPLSDGAKVCIDINGAAHVAAGHLNVAAAMLEAGVQACRATPVSGLPRGVTALINTLNGVFGGKFEIPEQRRRAGSPGHQTHHRTDDGVQGFSVCAHHPVWHRDRAHDPQGTDV
ncbi:hypothetical protein SBC1_77100 (plasmid) [Caballeronia sp. SBC1]|nr:hypothetical protein SBC2_80280 [Caballeronia sp. SBC2]QIN67663.1 hypothetical protein SBC1_77100 [Caballeronia sp. SBC1]